MRFHPTVNLSVLKFLAFEQTLKNALTTLPMGGGRGGSDFDPKGKSDAEVMRFCQALMLELHRHLGPDTDVPAGDIGVGAREVGFMAGMMKKAVELGGQRIHRQGLCFGGSLIRQKPPATARSISRRKCCNAGLSFDGMRVSVSGSGNVAQYAIEKAMALGAKVVTISGLVRHGHRRGRLHARENWLPDAHQERPAAAWTRTPAVRPAYEASVRPAVQWMSPCRAPPRTSWTKTTPAR